MINLNEVREAMKELEKMIEENEELIIILSPKLPEEHFAITRCNRQKQALRIIANLAQSLLDGKIGELVEEEEIRLTIRKVILDGEWDDLKEDLIKQLAKALTGKVGR